MSKQNNWDVVVVGGGPSGASAAKNCAERGMNTLLLEKYSLPRHKVCTGALMCNIAQNMVKEVFGDVPRDVLTNPPYIKGFIVYSPGYEGRVSEHRMPLAWRTDLDHWMDKLAVKAGSELWERAHVDSVTQDNDVCRIELRKEDNKMEITAKYVIGADGGNSIVRRSIFPDFQPRYMKAFQHVYEGSLSLDPNYVHWYVIFPDRYIFEVHQKMWQDKKAVVLDAQGRPGELAKMDQVMDRAKAIMTQECGFNPTSKLLHRDGCLDAMWLRELFTGAFLPAKGNILLVGDASGIRMPVTADGIGTGIKCGILAADAIKGAIDNRGKADELYLTATKPFLADLENLMPPRGYVSEQGKKGPEALLDAYKKIYDDTFKF